MTSNTHFCVSIVGVFATAIVLGCGGGSDAPDRFPLTGSVSYQGKPVPHGEILFIPDSAKGNQGPGAVAKIEDGRYQVPEDKGVIGGPHFVQVTGFDGPPIAGAVPAEGETEPEPLFQQYETEVDLPLESSTHDFDIPSSQQ